MKKEKLIRLILLPLIVVNTFGVKAQDLPDYKRNGRTEWTGKEWRSANTARFAIFMSRQMKQSIRFMNLARMYGSKFSEVYIEPIEEKTFYETSLIETLNKQRPMDPLRPSMNLWGASVIHSIYSGFAGTDGHQAFDFRLALTQPFSYGNMVGENCMYGAFSGLNTTLFLIIDRDVRSLGHRENILEPDFSRVGGGRFLHWRYGINSVFDFSSAKWIDFIFHQRPDITQYGLNLEVSQISDKPMVNLGAATFVSHLETTNMMVDLNYQYGVMGNNSQAVSGYLGYGSGTGWLNFMIGGKFSSYFPSDAPNLYIQPTISYFNVISFLRDGYLFEMGDMKKSAVYRLSYGYNFCAWGEPHPDVYKHNITLSRFISLTTKDISARRKYRD